MPDATIADAAVKFDCTLVLVDNTFKKNANKADIPQVSAEELFEHLVGQG